MDWKILRAYITRSVDQALLLRNEYLVTEHRLLRTPIKGRIRLSDGDTSGRIKARAMWCSFLRSAKTQLVKARCNAVSGWAAYCNTMSKRLHEPLHARAAPLQESLVEKDTQMHELKIEDPTHIQ